MKTPLCIAVCDLGSFSAIFLFAEVRHGRPHSLLEERHTVDLSYRPGSWAIARTGLRRAKRALRRFSRLVSRYKCARCEVIATAAIRDASNRDQVLRVLNLVSPTRIKVLSHRTEAQLTAEGALVGLPIKSRRRLVIDIGGGSTEVVCPPDVLRGVSIGAARATTAWAKDIPKSPGDRHEYLLHQAEHAMRGLRIRGLPRRPQVVAVGGTITSLAALKLRMRKFDVERLHGYTLNALWLNRTADELSALSQTELKSSLSFDPERARVLVAGAYLWCAILNRLQVDRVAVSGRGLRWGVAARLAQVQQRLQKTP